MSTPAGLTRFSSRSERLDRVFLRDRLKDARTYDRIAGYFRSSFFELIHEEIPTIGRVRIVCNADLDPEDVTAAGLAQAARDRAVMGSWHRQGDLSRVAIEQPRWQLLHEVLTRGNVEIRVVSRNNAPFLHGKAGAITATDGSTSSFVGSVNETANGWKNSYEIIWEDRSPESATWVQDEFNWLWSEGVPLPQAVIDEIGRVARRLEVGISDLADDPISLMKASLVESPLRMSGESLQPWQKSFVRIWNDHRERYGASRILLADEVGVGKTLSMAATGALSVMLGDGPFLILCPATLTGQWQSEMLLKLGIPSCRWVGSRGWIAPGEQWTGQTDILRCPMQIGIVSTGLLTTRNGSGPLPDAKKLLTGRFGMIALDEGHKARIQRDLSGEEEKGNLYKAIEVLAQRCRHMVIGTATPIQTDTREIWDLLKILAQGEGQNHVLGTSMSRWNSAAASLEVIRSAGAVEDENLVWDLVRNPFPDKREHQIFADLRQDLKLKPGTWISDKSLSDLPEDDLRRDLMRLAAKGDTETGGLPLLKYHNPLARHVVLRRREDLENAGLMERVDVKLWPDQGCDQILFEDSAVRTPPEFQAAYEEIRKAIKIMRTRSKVVSFLGKLIMQRICSSVEAGISTIERMIQGPDAVSGADYDDDEDREEAAKLAEALEGRGGETHHLREALVQLRRVQKAGDPKFRSVQFFLKDLEWDRYGTIIFSQYYDTARWVGGKVSGLFPNDPVAVYAGSGKAGIFVNGRWTSANRDDLKKMVENREIHLVCATDAACEGLNLQALGTLINMDLPWNPSRLQQRIGRIKRFGQKRKTVDMASLVYQGTVDEEIYARLSQRMRDNFEILGSLPDTIVDDWIKDEEKARKAMDDITDPPSPADMFRLRYGGFLKETEDDWDTFEKVISASDMGSLMRTAWKK